MKTKKSSAKICEMRSFELDYLRSTESKRPTTYLYVAAIQIKVQILLKKSLG